MGSTLYPQKHACQVKDAFRTIGWLLSLLALLLFPILFFCLVDDGIADPLDMLGALFWLIPLGIMLWGGIRLIRRGDIRYEWDEETFRRRRLLKPPITIPWSSITDLIIKYDDDQPVYSLVLDSGEMLRIDFSLIPEDHGLEGWLQRKLEPLYLNAIGAAELPLPFESFATDAGCTPGTLTLEADRIIQTKEYKDLSVAYDEIKFVLIESVPIRPDSLRRVTRYTLSGGAPEPLSFDAFYFKVPSILFFLRSRLKNALWVDITRSTPPEDPRAAEIYHERRIADGRKACKTAFTLAAIYISFALFFVVLSVHNHRFNPNAVDFAIFLATLYLHYKRDIWLGLLSRRALRRSR